MKKYITLVLFLLFSPSLFSQHWLKIDSVFSPFGVSAQNFSAPEFCDLDADGDFDLIVGSLSANRIEYFINQGNATTPLYRRDTNMFSSVYAQGYQFANSDYPAMADIDTDGDFDIVIGGFNGMLLFRNIGDSTEAVWQKDSAFFGEINSVIGTDAKPTFADIDGDGDVDLVIGIGESLFGGPTAGTTMAYRNNGTPQVPNFVSDNTIVTGIPDVGLNAYPTFKDLDNDGDLDLIMGRDLQTMIYYKNTGTKNVPIWTSTSGVVSSLETASYWKIPTFCDLDGDGDFDLIYGSSDGTIFYYQNIGNVTAPQFQRNTNYFHVIRTNGNGATVSLADLEKDGDVDMVSGDWLGNFQFFRNDGNSTKPKFNKITAPFSSIDAGSYSSPKFVDIDNDGDIDIVAGVDAGTIQCYINTNWTFTQNTTMFSGIDVGYRSAPAFADIDDDGNIDMLVGAEESAKLQFYANTGNNVYVAENGFIEGVVSARNGHPAFFDIDKDGDFDLAIGTISGTIYFYKNTGDKNSPIWERDDALFSGVKVNQSAAPAFADFDGDGKVDLIVGEYNGNFSYYKNLTTTSVENNLHTTVSGFRLEQNYPNPFNPTTTISFSIPSSVKNELSTIKIYDLIGREITTLTKGNYNPGTYSVTWDATEHPNGIYFYRLQSGNFSETKRMILLK